MATRGITLWYGAYGSNVNRRRFGRYLGVDVDDAAYPFDRWLVGTGRVRFAGRSVRWDGGVAFVDPSAPGTVIYRLYRITFEQFVRVWESENNTALPRARQQLAELLLTGVPGDETTVDTEGKYDTAAWIDHDDGLPVVALTSSHDLPHNPPCDRYLSTIELGLAEGPLADPLRRHYVDRLLSNGSEG